MTFGSEGSSGPTPAEAALAREQLIAVAADWMARLSEPEISAAEYHEWQQWIAADEVHAQAFAEIERVWNLALQLPATAPEQTSGAAELSLVESAHAAPAETMLGATVVSPRVGWARPNRVWAMSLAASVAIAVVGGTIWLSPTSRPAVFETATSEERTVRLNDGSQLVLGAQTRISVDIDSKHRLLELERGVANFKVAHDKSRPFVVAGGGHRVEAVGTMFSVDAKPERIVVSVSEGIVRVGPDARPGRAGAVAGSNAILLYPNERATIDEKGIRCTAVADASGEALDWRDGRLEYLREELRFVIADVNRYSNRRIVLSDAAVGRLEFSGTVLLEHIDDWLATLGGSFPVRVAADSDELVLSPTSSRAVADELASYTDDAQSSAGEASSCRWE